MTAATPLDAALLRLDTAVARLAGPGRRSPQARAVRAAAAEVRAAAAALGVRAGQIAPLDALAIVLDAARAAGVPWADLAAAVNAAGQALSGPNSGRAA